MSGMIKSPGVRTVHIRFDVDGKEYQTDMTMNWALIEHHARIDLTELQNEIRHGKKLGPEKRIIVPSR